MGFKQGEDSRILNQFYEDINNLGVIDATKDSDNFREFNYYEESSLDELFKLFQNNKIFGIIDFTTPNEIYPIELKVIQTRWNAIPPIVKEAFLNQQNLDSYAKTVDFVDDRPREWNTSYVYVGRYLLLMMFNIAKDRPNYGVVRKWVVDLIL